MDAASNNLSFPAWLNGFLDDAAVFPPASVPLAEAVTAHREHLLSPAAAVVGSLVVPDTKLADLIDVLDHLDDETTALPISVLVTGGAGAIGPAVTWACRAPHLALTSVEFALRDEADLAHNARRVLTALDAVEEDLSRTQVFVELPPWSGSPTHGWLSALDEVAAGELFVKLRTGGATPDLYPSAEDLVTSINAALDRELPFKVTGGLDAPLPRTDEAGLPHHGFLNLLVATRACLEGDDAVSALRDTAADSILARYDAETLGRTRSWLRSAGTPDLAEAYDDLAAVGVSTGSTSR